MLTKNGKYGKITSQDKNKNKREKERKYEIDWNSKKGRQSRKNSAAHRDKKGSGYKGEGFYRDLH